MSKSENKGLLDWMDGNEQNLAINTTPNDRLG